MIVITGAAGFIGSALLQALNVQGVTDLIIVDDFSRSDKNRNFEQKAFTQKVHRDEFFDWLEEHAGGVDFIFHLGARTDTAEKDTQLFDRLNLNYTKTVWKMCIEYGLPLLYASSAATYGLGEFGYEDNHEIVSALKPLNPYGISKNEFDKWALQQEKQPAFWAGIKFFNVYGPNEYHKRRMASVILHTVRQIKQTGGMKLFRSHKAGIADGYQKRDFVYVKDVVAVLSFFHQHFNTIPSGLYNLGTGKARPFIDLATATFHAMGVAPNISFIDTPLDIRDTYQYFTEANITKLRSIGYNTVFHTLEEGVKDYVQQHLMEEEEVW